MSLWSQNGRIWRKCGSIFRKGGCRAKTYSDLAPPFLTVFGSTFPKGGPFSKVYLAPPFLKVYLAPPFLKVYLAPPFSKVEVDNLFKQLNIIIHWFIAHSRACNDEFFYLFCHVNMHPQLRRHAKRD